jgi:hypothetical protein
VIAFMPAWAPEVGAAVVLALAPLPLTAAGTPAVDTVLAAVPAAPAPPGVLDVSSPPQATRQIKALARAIRAQWRENKMRSSGDTASRLRHFWTRTRRVLRARSSGSKLSLGLKARANRGQAGEAPR